MALLSLKRKFAKDSYHSEKIHVGIIGLGLVADAHLRAYQSLENIEVVAGSDINKNRLKESSETWGFNDYLDYEIMLQKEEIDILCICAPARYHCEIVEKVAPFKCHILCEKPLAISIQEAQRMIDICDHENVQLGYGASFRFFPALIKAKEIIQSGKLGEITLLTESFFGGEGIDNWVDLGEQHYPSGTPGGGGMGMMDHGIHLIDTFQWLLDDEICSVYGRGNYSCKKPQTEFINMEFKGGALGQLTYNEVTYSSDLPQEGIFSWGGYWDVDRKFLKGGRWVSQPGNIRIHGENGALRIFHYANQLFIFDKDGAQQVKLEGNPMPGNFALQMKTFMKNILNNDIPEVSGRDGLRALQATLALYQSSTSGQKILI